jgi:transcriptional regulator with XRE-family HTH domain
VTRRTRRPRTVIVTYRDIPWELDLAECRRALVRRQVAGVFDSMEALASAVGISRSTASRFFSGRPTSLKVTLAILKALRLEFDDVARPCDPDEATGDVA